MLQGRRAEISPVDGGVLPTTTVDGVEWEISVQPEYEKKFTLRNGVLVCKLCEAMGPLADLSSNAWRRVDKDNPSSPIVHKKILSPHLCLLSSLRVIQELYLGNLIPYSLFTKWMSLNGGDYQLGSSPKCMQLWDPFKNYKCKRDISQHIYEIAQLGWLEAIRLITCRKHGGFAVKILWPKLKHKDDVKVLNHIWRWSSDADHNKTNVSAADLIWHMKGHAVLRQRYDKWHHLMSTNMYNVTASALLMHLIGNEVVDCNLGLLTKYGFCCMDMKDYYSVLKLLSTAIRRTGRWPNGEKATLEEITGSAYWELAIGRSENKSDWEDEKHKRTKVTVNLGMPSMRVKSDATNAEYCRHLTSHLERIMAQMVPPARRMESFAEFAECRQRWVSPGSTGGAKWVLPNGERLRMNKQAYFDSISKEEIVSWLDTPPAIIATASEKFEMGKARAIYGTGVVDYAICAYVLDGIEEVMYRVDGIESGLTGLDFIATMIRRLKAVSKKGIECTMVDYADFNYQHTLLAQSLVFRVLARILAQRGYHPDKVRAANWIADALLNQWCKFPGDKGARVPVIQGMFSGVRGTNFMNTVLNLAYFELAREWIASNLNLWPSNLHHIHQGDDVWISNDSRLWALCLYRVCESVGLVFQPSKQLFDVNFGEFLRVVYVEGACRGYVARAVGSLIVKPIQGTEVVSPAERAVALNSQIMNLVRRGYSLEGAKVLWEAVVPYAARATLVEGAITIPRSYLIMSYLDNGLDLGHPRTAAVRCPAVAPIPTMSLECKQLAKDMPCHMAQDYVNIMSRKLRSSINYDTLVENMHNTNIVGSMRQEDRVLCLRRHERELRKWLDEYRGGSVIRNETEYNRIKGIALWNPGFESWLDRVSRNVLEKVTRVDRTRMGTLMAAICTSPFRNLANAVAGTGLKLIPAAMTAISSCPNTELAAQAAGILVTIERRLGVAETHRILNGLKTGATKYECEYHPVLLSWVQDRAIDYAIGIVLVKPGVKEGELLEFVAAELDRHVRSLDKYPIFKMISNY